MKRWGIAGTTLLLSLIGMSATAAAQQNRGQPAHAQQSTTHPAAVPAAVQHQRVQQQQQRVTQYKQQLTKQVPVVQKQAVQLQTQKRTAQYHVQQQYTTKLKQQQQNLSTPRNYASDPYVKAPSTYRYVVSGAARETNSYGVTMLRQAVNDGYQQGYLGGQADRQDRWKSDYQNSPAYRDANYGYTGNYIDQSDYNYYFRQGFQRGYEDAYGNHFQYGSSSNGTYSILANVLSSILGLQPIG
jgi:TolA-binding protein